MLVSDTVVIDKYTLFRTLTKEHLSFEEVYAEIVRFISADTSHSYKISIGTDSQVKNSTTLVTCIHVHRIGMGAIGFLHKSHMKRPVTNLREKIYLETSTTLQLAYLFDSEKMQNIKNILAGKGKNLGVHFEFHIDIGSKGETKTLIKEMLGMVKGLEFIPRIKPDSYCASCFADRYTKAI